MPVFRAKHFSVPSARQKKQGDAAAQKVADSSSGTLEPLTSVDDTSVFLRAALGMSSLADRLPEISVPDMASRVPEIVQEPESAPVPSAEPFMAEEGKSAPIGEPADAEYLRVDQAQPETLDALANQVSPEPLEAMAEQSATGEAESAYEAPIYEQELPETYANDEASFPSTVEDEAAWAEEPVESDAAVEPAYDEGPLVEETASPVEDYVFPSDDESFAYVEETSEEPAALAESPAEAFESGYDEEADQEGVDIPAEPEDEEEVFADESEELDSSENVEELAQPDETEAVAETVEDITEAEDEEEPFEDLPPIEIAAIEAPQAVVFAHDVTQSSPVGNEEGSEGVSTTIQAPVRYERPSGETRQRENLDEAIEHNVKKTFLGLQLDASGLDEQQYNMQAFLVAAVAALVIVGGTILLITHPWNPGSNISRTETEETIDTSNMGSIAEIETLSGQDGSDKSDDSEQAGAQETFDQLSSYYQRLLQLRATVGDSDTLLRASLASSNTDVVDAGLETASQVWNEVGELCEQINSVDTSAGYYVEEQKTLSELGGYLKDWTDTLVEGWNALDTAGSDSDFSAAREIITRDDENGVNAFQTLFDEKAPQFTLTEPSGDAA